MSVCINGSSLMKYAHKGSHDLEISKVDSAAIAFLTYCTPQDHLSQMLWSNNHENSRTAATCSPALTALLVTMKSMFRELFESSLQFPDRVRERVSRMCSGVRWGSCPGSVS